MIIMTIQMTIVVCRWCPSGQSKAGGPRRGWWWWWGRARRRRWLRGRGGEAARCSATAADHPGPAEAQRGHEERDGQVGGGGETGCYTCEHLSDNRSLLTTHVMDSF